MTFTDIWAIRPAPTEGAVIAGEGWRITVLTDRLLRLEYEPEGRFRDGATQAVINREFPLPAFTVRDSGDRLSIETDGLRLEYDKKPFSAEGLSAVLKNALLSHASVWHYGESVGNLKGTARTLDQADGGVKKAFFVGEQDKPLEMGDGLMSMDGFAVLDDSRSMGMDAQGNLSRTLEADHSGGGAVLTTATPRKATRR